MFLLGILCYACFPKKLGSSKVISLKTRRRHLLIGMNTSLVKKNGNSLLSTSYFHIVHYINIWTNVNSYNHNTGHSNDITKADKVLTILFMVCIKPLRLVA